MTFVRWFTFDKHDPIDSTQPPLRSTLSYSFTAGRQKTTQSTNICLRVRSPAPGPGGEQEQGAHGPRPLSILCLAGKGDVHPVLVGWVCSVEKSRSHRSFTWSGRGAMARTIPPRVTCPQVLCVASSWDPAHCLQTCLSTPGFRVSIWAP